MSPSLVSSLSSLLSSVPVPSSLSSLYLLHVHPFVPFLTSSPPVLYTLVFLLLQYVLYRRVFLPKQFPSKNFLDPKSNDYVKRRLKCFMPPYPNGWYAVCNTADLSNGSVKSIVAFGRHLVAFREGVSNKVGVLHAFCPHMEAHLGQGGKVVGDTLVCPFHEWKFTADGKCRDIPYMKEGTQVPERAKTKSYPAVELLGVVYAWFHVEPEHENTPLWQLSAASDLARGVEKGDYYFAVMRQLQFSQHICEMAMNSADPFHFLTLHGPFPVPGIEKVVHGVHRISAEYGEGRVEGKVVSAEHLTLFKEKTEGLYFNKFAFLGKWNPLSGVAVPLSEWMSSMVTMDVTFEGPSIMHFEMTTPLGKMRQVKSILPVGPFDMYIESRWYAEKTIPTLMVQFIAYVGAKALEQDRQVWEHKMFNTKPMLAPNGDGPFPAFIRWYKTFYSEGSKKAAMDNEGKTEW